MRQIKTIILFAFLLTIAPGKLFAQRTTELELEGGIRVSDLVEPASFYLSLKTVRWLNPYFAYTIGGGLSFVRINTGFRLPHNTEIRYHIDDRVFDFLAITGLRLATPAFRNIGLMADVNFMIEPIPLGFVSVSRTDFSNPPGPPARSYHSRFVYTRFNSGYNIQLSAFHNFNSEDFRLAVGFGFGNFNPLNTYYRAVLNDIRLSNYLRLRPERMNFSIFVRFSSISL